jgi:hypothetical protein
MVMAKVAARIAPVKYLDKPRAIRNTKVCCGQSGTSSNQEHQAIRNIKQSGTPRSNQERQGLLRISGVVLRGRGQNKGSRFGAGSRCGCGCGCEKV